MGDNSKPVEPGHPLVLIVLAMRATKSADEAIQTMGTLSTSWGASVEATKATTELIQAVRDQEITVSQVPQRAHDAWVTLTKGAKVLVHSKGVTQAYKFLDEYLNRAGRWNWGHTNKTIPIRQFMRKFQVDVEVPFPTAQFEVWGHDEDSVETAFEEADIENLFDDLGFDVTVQEIPEEPAHEIRDGVALADRGWIPPSFYKDEEGSGELIWPTDEESRDNLESGREIRRLENEGQQRLPMGSADPSSE